VRFEGVQDGKEIPHCDGRKVDEKNLNSVGYLARENVFKINKEKLIHAFVPGLHCFIQFFKASETDKKNARKVDKCLCPTVQER
jgi:hypothetical protein